VKKTYLINDFVRIGFVMLVCILGSKLGFGSFHQPRAGFMPVLSALRQSLIKSKGTVSIFFSSAISATCLIIAVALMVAPLIPRFRRPGATLEHEEVT
jgi:hypothetical protein